MTDPVRLVHGEGTPFEQELLNSVLQEPVPPQLHAQMAAGLGLLPLAAVPDAGFGVAAKVQAGSSFSLLKVAALSLGLSGAGAVGFGLWHTEPKPALSAASTSGGAMSAAAQSARPASDTSGDPQVTAPPRVAAVSPAAVSSGEPEISSNVDEPATVISQRSRTASRSARPVEAHEYVETHEYIEKELRLLDPARAALKQGDRARALRLLEEYERRFPTGSLRREAVLLRGLANPK